jgi:hypothetical protein
MQHMLLQLQNQTKPINQSINQSTELNEKTKKSINQSINQSSELINQLVS